MDNELLLFDRINVIKDVINKYGEDNFYISFSGGKDSTVVHYLLDLAVPGNKIPRVYANTGIEYTHIVEFVKNMAEEDDRFIIIRPSVNIRKMLEKDGYPFKSKEHSCKVRDYKRGSKAKSIQQYAYAEGSFGKKYSCPKILRYQFTDEFSLKISDKCCLRMKKEPFKKYESESGRKIGITGIRMAEGGERASIKNCVIFRNGSIKRFHPLVKVNDEWEDWFIKEYGIRLCDLYYPPYNFKRTGCKGCPYDINLQKTLNTMQTYLPNERAQCEIIWKPVYDEYRRIGYRLKKEEQLKLF